MSKPKGKQSDADQLLTQGWHTLVDTIRLLPLYPKQSTDSTGAEREHDIELAIHEKNTLDVALDQVALLIQLRAGEAIPPHLLPILTAKVPTRSPVPPPLGASSSSASVSASTSAAASGPPTQNNAATAAAASAAAASPAPQTAGVKRKHRVSVSASPAPPGLTSGRDGHMAPLTSSRHASPMPGTSKASAAHQAQQQRQQLKHLTTKEVMQDQMPLQQGRRVAYLRGLAPGQGGAEWILCIVSKSAPGDKARYEVVDADDGTTHNTTIRSLIPLPDSSLPITSLGHPNNMEDWPRDSQVLALYPHTTEFYHGIVRSAPIPGTGHGLGPRGGAPKRKDNEALDGMYRVAFQDDGDTVWNVPKDDVAPVWQFLSACIVYPFAPPLGKYGA